MAEIESKVVHIKIEPEEAIDNKRKLLEMQISMLNMIKKYYNFKKFNREEGKNRIMIRRLVNEITRDIDSMSNMLPKEEAGARPILKVKRGKLLGEESQATLNRKSEEKRLDEELEEIQERLAKLG